MTERPVLTIVAYMSSGSTSRRNVEMSRWDSHMEIFSTDHQDLAVKWMVDLELAYEKYEGSFEYTILVDGYGDDDYPEDEEQSDIDARRAVIYDTMGQFAARYGEAEKRRADEKAAQKKADDAILRRKLIIAEIETLEKKRSEYPQIQERLDLLRTVLIEIDSPSSETAP